MIYASVRKGWRSVKFGDVVERVAESRVPSAEESLTYIGLEHLDQDSYVIRRWGSDVPLEVPKTPVRAGDVLFARRNTHLRRCAVAPFDTCFSPDGYALRSSGNQLVQEYLLHIVASQSFMDFAVEHSAGTHSKRVKWSDLVKYEFALPPIDEQKSTIEVLAAVGQVVERARTVALETERAHDAWAAAVVLWSGASLATIFDGRVEQVRLSDVALLKRGRFSHRPRNEARLYADISEYPFVQTGDVERSGGALQSFSQYLSEEGIGYSRSVGPGTLLVTIAAVIGATARTTCETYLPDSIVSVEAVDGLATTEFLELSLRGLRRHLENSVATENTQKNLSVEKLGAVEIHLPPLDAQMEAVRRSSAYRSVALCALENEKQAIALASLLRETLLGNQQ